MIIMNDPTATASASYRHLNGLYLEQLSYQYESDICAFVSPINVAGDPQGKIGGIGLTLHHSLGPGFYQRLHYAHQTTLDSDIAISDAYSAIPAYTTGYQIAWVPFDNVAIWEMLSYQSSSLHCDYQDAGPQICPFANLIQPVYSPRLSSVAILDLSMKKWFWKRRVSGQIILRNIMNEDLRYHPVGAGFDLSMIIQVNALLDMPDKSSANETF